jgi:hypothetical protein
MNHDKRHVLWMGIGFVVVLIAAKFAGVGMLLLFPLFCFFMMAVMMLGMDHGGNDNNQHNHK